MRPGLFVPIKWRLPECPRLILPLAVNLKRFLAPRWVFNFNFGFDLFLGIAGVPLPVSSALRASKRVLKVQLECQAEQPAHPQQPVPAFYGADYCDCWALDDC